MFILQTVKTVEEIAERMAGYRFGPEEQVRQTTLRAELVRFWGIESGARVLEIGCGQGDTTAVLAEVVGETGEIVAFDPAPASYGAPISIGESLAHLQAQFPDVPLSCVVGRPLSEIVGTFDWVVFSHCSWYFEDGETLLETLRKTRDFAPRLAFSEWDLRLQSVDQLPHLLAVLIQSASPVPEGNIRTPFSRGEIGRLLAESGWDIRSESIIDSSTLADGRWEVAVCHEIGSGATDLRLATHFALLNQQSPQDRIASLPSWAAVCSR